MEKTVFTGNKNVLGHLSFSRNVIEVTAGFTSETSLIVSGSKMTGKMEDYVGSHRGQRRQMSKVYRFV